MLFLPTDHREYVVQHSLSQAIQELLYELICHCVYHPLILEESLAAPPRLTPTSKELASIREALGISSEVDSIVRARVEKFAPGKEVHKIMSLICSATADRVAISPCHFRLPPFQQGAKF